METALMVAMILAGVGLTLAATRIPPDTGRGIRACLRYGVCPHVYIGCVMDRRGKKQHDRAKKQREVIEGIPGVSRVAVHLGFTVVYFENGVCLVIRKDTYSPDGFAMDFYPTVRSMIRELGDDGDMPSSLPLPSSEKLKGLKYQHSQDPTLYIYKMKQILAVNKVLLDAIHRFLPAHPITNPVTATAAYVVARGLVPGGLGNRRIRELFARQEMQNH